MFAGELWITVRIWPLFWQLIFIFGLTGAGFIALLTLLHRRISFKMGEGISFDRMRAKRRKADG